MHSTDEQLLLELTQANAVAGNEGEARTVFKRYAEPYADQLMYDGLGSIIAKHVGDKEGPKIFFAGHLDEVGFMVTQVTAEGFIKFQPLGGWWGQVMLAQQVRITTSTNEVFHGVIGSKPPHVLTKAIRNKVYEITDMFIDIGATSEQEVKQWGIRPGDMITPYTEYRRLNHSKFLLAKAWDNRIGTAVSLKVLENLAVKGHPNTIYAGSTVQEEVGLRGAQTSSHLVNPEISFALDTGTAGDTPGMTAKESDSMLGKGPQLLLYDASMIPHKRLRDFVVQVAEEEEIPFQYTVIPRGGTDAGKMHVTRNGVPSLAITVPVRYLHSHASIIHEEDYHHTVKLVTAVIERLTSEAVKKICTY